MKNISRKYVFLVLFAVLLVLGAGTVIYEIKAIAFTINNSQESTKIALKERYDELVAEQSDDEENLINIEGYDVMLGKTTVQDFIDGTGLKVDKDSSYYYISDYTYSLYKNLSAAEIYDRDSIYAIGSGTVKAYKSGYKTDIELVIASGVWVDDDNNYSRTLPDLDECYIVQAEFTRYPGDTKRYQFECSGINQDMDYEEIAELLGSADDSGYSSDGKGYRNARWDLGRRSFLTYWRSYSDDENTMLRYETLSFGYN